MTCTTEYTAKPSRVQDYLLGGWDHRSEDQERAERILEVLPEARDVVQARFRFTGKALQQMAGHFGISQFLVLGSARLTGSPAIHEAARAACPGSRIAYVDPDPLIAERVAQFCAGSDKGIVSACADIADPAAVLSHPAVAKVIDPGRPGGLISGMVLSFLPPAVPSRMIAGYAELIAPGSALAVACMYIADPGVLGRVQAAWEPGKWANHDAGEIQSWFTGAGLRLLHGQTGDVADWPMLVPAQGTSAKSALVAGGIGIKD